MKNMNELLRLSQPLMAYLQINYNPHCRIVIEFGGVKIVEDVYHIPNNEKAHPRE